MRVLHLIKTSVGGAWAWREMRELVALGVDVHVGLPPGGQMMERYSDIGVKAHTLATDLPITRPHQYLAAAEGVRSLVDEITPDLIHAHNVGTVMLTRLALGRRSGIPRIFQVPGPLHLEAAHTRVAELQTAGTLDHWIASCEYTRRLYLAAGVPPDRVSMSYYGTDVEDYAPRPPGNRLRAELGVQESTPLIGMVAYMYAPKRLTGQRRGLKGHEDLVDAIELLVEARADVVAVFVGGAWNHADRYERRVRQYAAHRCGPRARFLGTRRDVADLYPDFDVAVHPSHSENVGGAVESLLLGIPTIASGVGGMPELVRGGVTGWLVPPRDPAALARAIQAVLSHRSEARLRAERGRALAAELFDVRSTAAEVLGIYQRVLNPMSG